MICGQLCNTEYRAVGRGRTSRNADLKTNLTALASRVLASAHCNTIYNAELFFPYARSGFKLSLIHYSYPNAHYASFNF